MYTATWSGAGITQGLGVVLDAALYQDYQTKTGPQDAWGNLKIPRLEGFANSTKNPEGCIFGYIMDISQTDLWGIPMTVELFMKDPATQPVTPLDSPELWSYLGLNTLISAVNFTEFTQDEFATRLALLLNTISHIFLTLGQLEAGLPSDLSLYGPDHTLVGGSNYLKGLTIIILLLASGVLVGLGLFGIWRSRNLRAPDIFDPVMAFTYGNKYIDVPEYGSTLDAKRRARLLPNVEVRLGDVDGHWGVGKVALGMAQDVHLLKKDRLYE
ncbi:hypothetical protein UCREL1_11209 [Eutypa lata UCREL1]|uniref:Uncharacterized protein n=1 Tax=Eutypa lata (strain UCR-EL1) TaxID=1287681 RepID=M7SCE6_EUTLA|nr:hypothetical protein UCREL1_11209 [Eutypa lata UCREL1]